MKKKFLALVLTLAMVLSLVPVTALATDGPPDTTTEDVVYGHYTNEGKWESGKPENAIPESLKGTVTVDKTATKVANQDNQYEVTLTVQMKHKTEEVQPGAAATVLVIDTSGSMDYCTDPTHTHKKDKYGNRCGTWNGRTSRLSVAKTAAINFLKSYSGFSDSDFTGNGSLKNGVSDKNLNRYVSLVTFDDSASVQTWGKRNDKKSWIDVSTKDGYKKLLDAINDIEAGGGTNLDAALRLATTQMQSGSIAQIDQSKRNVIALTDGVPTYYVSIDTGWFGTDENVSQHGNYGCPDTNVATTRSADALKADGTAVYTVCFGAANDICWTKDSVHVEHTFKDDEKHTTDGPKVGKFLEDNIATLSTSEKKYAYNADDAENLYKAFAAITQTITDGLNEGVVTDGLPEGVMPVEGSGFATTWTLDSSSVTPTTSDGYNVYTYTKTYKVNVDPDTVNTVEVGGVNYAPLNTPTILTVQHNNSPVQIPFPIPAGKVTYSLTDFNKELVTQDNKPSFNTNDFTIPDTKDSTVTVGENGVTLLYKITVKGNAGAKFTVTDDGAMLVPSTDDSIVFNQTSSTFSGTVGNTGTTVFYVSKHFDVSTGMTSVSNTAIIAPGDNANGPADDKKTKTVTTTVEEKQEPNPNPEPATGTLTITKKVVGDGLTVDSLPENFQITVKNTQDEIKGTLTKTEEAKKEDGTLTWTIRDLPAGEEYTVSEENADVDGYNCTATYSATNDATVTVNGTASAVQNQLATDAQASQKVTVTENRTSTMTVTNKYTEKEVEPPTPPDPVELDVSRSKTAKPLDTSTWTSNVTLSLPSAEYEPVIDVVFILDNTYAGNGIFKDAATGLLNELSEKKNLDVNVGIVNFDAVARDWLAATTNSKYSGLVSLKNTEGLTALQNAIDTKLDKNNDGQTKKIGATNIEWPLEMAQNMLASGKGTEKYAILFSDMYGYVYRGDLIIDGQTYENVPLSKRLYAGESKFYQGSLSMGTKYQSFADVYAHRNDEENQTTDGFFRDSSWNSYWSIYSGHMQIPTNPATKDSADPFGVPGGYSGFEKSTCLVYDRLLQMKQAGINISIVNNDFAPGDIREVGYVQSIKNDMLDTLEQKGISVIKTQENVTAEDMTNVFDTLKDQLIQVVSAGSTVTDKIGTNFDFVGLNTMSLKIGDNTIPGVIDEATNTITFKHGGKDNAHVVVYDSSADSFTWTINEDVTKDARVQLTYSVKLTKPETAAGTYGVTDLNGDGKVDGTDTTYTDTDALYTNESATLVPVNSAGKQGQPLLFPKPSVSYTIKGSSGGHGGGTVTIPDDVPTGLNGKDHYAYVVGYPDGMVYPQKNITRAEVATIFFRLLKDETREANMTKSNGYNDMKDGAWYTCAVSTLSKMGIIKGYEDGSFKPDASISRAEFAAIAARFDPDGDKTPATFSDVSSHWAKDEISIAANHGWIKGYEDGSFKPDQKITRAETMTLVNRVLKRLPETKDDLHKDMKTWPDNQNESAWFYLAVQEATNSHYQKLKKDGTHETWESMRETRDWAALEK